jgi:hypothetical protein
MRQLSIFLENKLGRINEVTKILAQHDINIYAFSMTEGVDFGILRLIVTDVDKAIKALRKENLAVMLTDVICISCSDKAGALSEILDYLVEEDIFIEYMYAFSHEHNARIVIRPSNLERCLELLKANHCQILEDDTI